MRLIDAQGRLLGRVNLIDAAALFFLLFSTGILLHFAYHNTLRHTTLTLEEAQPSVFVPGVDRFLSIFGNGFQENLRIEVDGKPPLKATWVNEARIDLQLPETIEPGDHHILVRNPNGRMAFRSGLFQVRWEPVVESITLVERRLNEATYRLTGRYLDRSCSIRVDGHPPIRMEYRNPQEVLFVVPAFSEEFPGKQLSVQNGAEGGQLLSGEALLEKLALDHSPAAAKPRVLSVMPSRLRADQGNGLVLLGHELKTGCTVRVGPQPLQRLEWFPPHAVLGFLPADSLVPGEYAVELVNPNGEKVTVERMVSAIREVSFAATPRRSPTTTLEVDLFLPGVTRQELKQFLAEEKSPPFHLLKFLNRGVISKQVEGVTARVRLPVEIVETEGQEGSPVYVYNEERLLPGRCICLSPFKGRTVCALVRSFPEGSLKERRRK